MGMSVNDTANDAGLSEADLDRLEKLAKAATPGGWDLEDPMAPHSYAIVETGKPTHEWRFIATLGLPDEDDHDFTAREVTANGEFIAAFDPPTALKLLAIARRRMAGGEGTGAAEFAWPPALWTCTDCNCRSWARFDVPAKGGGYTKGEGVRCVHCKREHYPPARAKAATAPAGGGDNRERIDGLLADAHARFERRFRDALTPDAPAKPPKSGDGSCNACGFAPVGRSGLCADCEERGVHWDVYDGVWRDAPAKPGQGGEGALREALDALKGELCRNDVSTGCERAFDRVAALAAPPADAALRSALDIAQDALNKCDGLFTSIRNDWTDPRSDCREGWEVIRLAALKIAALTTAAPADGAPEVEG